MDERPDGVALELLPLVFRKPVHAVIEFISVAEQNCAPCLVRRGTPMILTNNLVAKRRPSFVTIEPAPLRLDPDS